MIVLEKSNLDTSVLCLARYVGISLQIVTKQNLHYGIMSFDFFMDQLAYAILSSKSYSSSTTADRYSELELKSPVYMSIVS